MKTELIKYSQYKFLNRIFTTEDELYLDYFFVVDWTGFPLDTINCANYLYLLKKHNFIELSYGEKGTQTHKYLIAPSSISDELQSIILKTYNKEIINEESYLIIEDKLYEQHFNDWGRSAVIDSYFSDVDITELKNDELLDKFKDVADLDSRSIVNSYYSSF